MKKQGAVNNLETEIFDPNHGVFTPAGFIVLSCRDTTVHFCVVRQRL